MNGASPALPAAFLQTPLAHRGLHDHRQARPENSIAAVEAAVTAGYGVEIDVRASSDGVAMVFHDAGLRRLTGRREEFATLDAAALSALTLVRGAERIPRLADVLALVAGRVPLLIELKSVAVGYQGSDGMLEAGVARALEGYDGPVAVMSFNPDMVAGMAERAPGVARGLTTGAWHAREALRMSPAYRRQLRAIADFDRSGASFISHQHSDLRRRRVRELRKRGVPVLCWTIRNARIEGRARLLADNITFEGYRPASGATA